MIIPDDQLDKDTKATVFNNGSGIAVVTEGDQTRVIGSNTIITDDNPPPYAPRTSYAHTYTGNRYDPGRDQAASNESTGASSSSAVDAQRPSNWIYARRMNGGLKASYTIDPTLQIPVALLSDPASALPESERDNLNLTAWNGSLEATLHIINGRADDTKKRARLTLHSKNGAVKCKVLPNNSPRPKFLLTADSLNGSVTIYIPRTFSGPISASTLHGSVSFSTELQRDVTTFADGNTKKCFLGDFSQFEDGKEEQWDELKLDTKNGSIRVFYTDEDASASTSKMSGSSKNFWGRLFGL